MRRMITQVLCDMDPTQRTPADTSVAFAYEGRRYELDLSKEKAEEFAAVLHPWVKAAHPAGRSQVNGNHMSKTAAMNDRRKTLKAIRTWARENGYEVSDHGRVPAAVEEAYWDSLSGQGKGQRTTSK